MKITRLRIQNFRGIHDLTLELDEVVLLVGENNSCKTAILEAIEFCLGPSIRRRSQVFEDDDYRYVDESARPGDAGPLVVELQFQETADDRWSADVVRALNEVVVTDPVSALYRMTFRIVSTRAQNGVFDTVWEFLNEREQPLGGQASSATVLQTFQRISPFFLIRALRDAEREFQARSSYWGPFLRDVTSMDAAEITEFENSINELNSRIVACHESLEQVQVEVTEARNVIGTGLCGEVSVDALPARLADVLSRSTLNMGTPGGAKLPITRHGAGLQSLAVFLLFQAYVKSQLQRAFDELAFAVVGIEEPETHLHPAAARLFAQKLVDLPGQKIITTHSGDIASGFPITSLRRLYMHNGQLQVGRVTNAHIGVDRQRHIDFFIRATRGELLFSRVWLLGEGQTEFWLAQHASEAMGISLDLHGVRFVEFAGANLSAFIDIANELGIKWVLFCDSDQSGQDYVDTATARLNGADPRTCICSLPGNQNVEQFLIQNGFQDVLESIAGPNRLLSIANFRGTPEYEAQLARVVRKVKTECAVAVGRAWTEAGRPIPAEIQAAITSAIRLGGAP